MLCASGVAWWLVPTRASAATRKKQRGNRLDVLAQDLNVWEAEREERVQELAEKHGMKAAEVHRRMLALPAYGVRRKPSTYNTKISRIMARLNAGELRLVCACGACHIN
jgi:hypothetical protein